MSAKAVEHKTAVVKCVTGKFITGTAAFIERETWLRIEGNSHPYLVPLRNVLWVRYILWERRGKRKLK